MTVADNSADFAPKVEATGFVVHARAPHLWAAASGLIGQLENAQARIAALETKTRS